MIVSPTGPALISGQAGRAALIDTETLRLQAVRPPQGVALMSAEYSPDGGHVAVPGKMRLAGFHGLWQGESCP